MPGNGNGILGTDALGRDVLARLLQGGWSLLLLAAISTVLAVLLGAIAGVVAAYRGQMTETLIMRTVDVMLAIPQLVFVLADRQCDRCEDVAGRRRRDPVSGPAGRPGHVRLGARHLRT